MKCEADGVIVFVVLCILVTSFVLILGFSMTTYEKEESTTETKTNNLCSATFSRHITINYSCYSLFNGTNLRNISEECVYTSTPICYYNNNGEKDYLYDPYSQSDSTCSVDFILSIIKEEYYDGLNYCEMKSPIGEGYTIEKIENNTLHKEKCFATSYEVIK